MNLQCYTEAVLGIQLAVTWKMHVPIYACAHLSDFLTNTGQGLAPYAEQTGESVHAKMKSLVNCNKIKLEHPAHDIHQHRAVVEFSGNNIQFMYCEILQDWNFLDFVITVVDEIVLNLLVRDTVYK